MLLMLLRCAQCMAACMQDRRAITGEVSAPCARLCLVCMERVYVCRGRGPGGGALRRWEDDMRSGILRHPWPWLQCTVVCRALLSAGAGWGCGSGWAGLGWLLDWLAGRLAGALGWRELARRGRVREQVRWLAGSQAQARRAAVARCCRRPVGGRLREAKVDLNRHHEL